ncbi:hypothetical protein BDV93DRAFT_572878 [Ceratobasidium sp. AG-I]|nr:hypothetical protein BDV93DRAFT_572878 [Ceratobasidium sp. AG-I]
MSAQKFPNLSTAEAKACELLFVCFVRSGQISEQIRATEPDRARTKLAYDQVYKDLQAEPGSIWGSATSEETHQITFGAAKPAKKLFIVYEEDTLATVHKEVGADISNMLPALSGSSSFADTEMKHKVGMYTSPIVHSAIIENSTLLPLRTLGEPLFGQSRDLDRVVLWVADPHSISHGPPRSDVVLRAQYLKRCREFFDGDAETLYEIYRAFFAVFFAIQVITELELKDSNCLNFLINEAHNRSVEVLTGRDPASASQAHEQNAYLNLVAMDFELGDIVPYTLNGETCECLVINCGSSYLKGDWFLVKDGPVDGQMEEREITASEMEE